MYKNYSSLFHRWEFLFCNSISYTLQVLCERKQTEQVHWNMNIERQNIINAATLSTVSSEICHLQECCGSLTWTSVLQ